MSLYPNGVGLSLEPYAVLARLATGHELVHPPFGFLLIETSQREGGTEAVNTKASQKFPCERMST